MTQKTRIRTYLLPCLACILLLTACNPKGEISGTATYTDYYDGCSYPAGGALLYRVERMSNGTERTVSTVTATNDGTYIFQNVKDGDWVIRAKLNKEDVIYEGRSEPFYLEKDKSVTINCHLDKTQLMYASRLPGRD